MPGTPGLTDPAFEGKHMELVRARDAGLTPDPAALASVRARYLLAMRERFQTDKDLSAVIVASFPATSAFEAVASATEDICIEGTDDIRKDAIMFLLAELDELRKAGDSAYIVDTSTGEIVAPVVDNIIVQPPPFMDETGVTRVPARILNPEVAATLALTSAAKSREAEIRKKAAHPIAGRAYRHLTEPERILELAAMKLAELGVDPAELEGGQEETITFGLESEEADLQSTNPMYHRLWSYSSALAAHVFRRAGKGGKYRIGNLSMERNGESRWYEVRVRTANA